VTEVAAESVECGDGDEIQLPTPRLGHERSEAGALLTRRTHRVTGELFDDESSPPVTPSGREVGCGARFTLGLVGDCWQRRVLVGGDSL
jgi:hypothetical protein